MNKWKVSLCNGDTTVIQADRWYITSDGLYFYKGAPVVACFAAGKWISFISIEPAEVPMKTPSSGAGVIG